MVGLEKSGLLEKAKKLWDKEIPLQGEVKAKGIANNKKSEADLHNENAICLIKFILPRERVLADLASPVQGHKHDEGTGASFIRGNAGKAGTPGTGEGQAGVDLTDVYKYPTGGGGVEAAKLFPAVPPDRQWAQTKTQEISPEHRKTLFSL